MSSVPSGKRTSQAQLARRHFPTGLSGLDHHLFPRHLGQPTSTLLHVEEDVFSTYATLFTRVYIATGLALGHTVLVLTADCPDLWTCLPKWDAAQSTMGSTASDRDEDPSESKPEADEVELKIGWRYAKTRQVSFLTTPVTSDAPKFDFSTTMPRDTIPANRLKTHCVNDLEQAFRWIRDSAQAVDGPLRIVVHGLGSPIWTDRVNEEDQETSTLKFIHRFYRLVHSLDSALGVVTSIPQDRANLAVALGAKSNPTSLLAESIPQTLALHLCDTAISFKSFLTAHDTSGTGTVNASGPVASSVKDYHGLIRILKVWPRRVNDGIEKAVMFRLRRKRWVIEKWFMPPELGESPSRTQNRSNTVGEFVQNPVAIDF